MSHETVAPVRRTVLIVDEDLLSGRALVRDFNARGYEVQLVNTFNEATKAVRAATPDLVVLDCYLNNRSALEVLRSWKLSAPKLNVILISANASLTLAVDAMREGAIGFCAKPVTVGAILEELEHRTASAVSVAPLLSANNRLCAESLHADGVDRFFAISKGLMCIAGFDGYFKMLNRAWETALGYTLDELCSAPYLELVHPDDRDKASDEALQMNGGESIFYFRNRYRCKSGAYKWLAWNASPAPRHQLIYASASDITQAVNVEERLSETATRLRRVAEQREDLLDTSEGKNETLQQLNRFKEEMSGLLVHDLKNPLTVIVANYDFLMRSVVSSPEGMEALVDSQNASRRMMRLLDNLLDVTRLEDNRLVANSTSTNVSRLLNDILTQRRMLAQSRRVTLEANLPADTVLEVDADLLTRTVENIIDNALRYTPVGGRIEVELRDTGESIEARIGNTGEAVPTDKRVVIFDKYQRDARQTRNLGVGLYFCRLATEAQGGKIWVEETETLPTVFAIRLPRRAKSALAASRESGAAA